MRAIIFSRDRPAQLDLLLRSLERNAVGFSDVVVIYRATSGPFERGYEIVGREHEDARLFPEVGLTYQIRGFLVDRMVVSFFTDDDVLFAPIGGEALAALGDDSVATFSLRLGRNTTVCYPHRRPQVPPHFRERDGTLFWDWRFADGDFGYPLSLDGHILRTADLRRLVGSARFSNPNVLEGILAHRAEELGRPMMASYERSALVSIPANRVTETEGNRFGEEHPRSLDGLLYPFLDGRRLDLDALDFSTVDGAHRELPLAFSKEDE